jgi:pantoate kinase
VRQQRPFSFGGKKEDFMKKCLFVAAAVSGLIMPAMAEEIGVRAGPVGAGVTVGEGHRDYDRDRDRDRTTVIREHEPRDRETVIKKEREDGVETKTTIHQDRD